MKVNFHLSLPDSLRLADNKVSLKKTFANRNGDSAWHTILPRESMITQTTWLESVREAQMDYPSAEDVSPQFHMYGFRVRRWAIDFHCSDTSWSLRRL
jgi:hypothetical protein